MLNQIVLVGRIVSTPQINETKNGEKESIITLAIPRGYKNSDGEYDTDFIDCVLYGGIAKNTAEYCRSGDLIGIKGKVSRLNGEKLKLVAERVTFLSSKPTEKAE